MLIFPNMTIFSSALTVLGKYVKEKGGLCCLNIPYPASEKCAKSKQKECKVNGECKYENKAQSMGCRLFIAADSFNSGRQRIRRYQRHDKRKY